MPLDAQKECCNFQYSERISPMKINGTPYRSVWPIGTDAFGIIDQSKLPHAFETLTLTSADDAAHVIKAMITRGAPPDRRRRGLWPGARHARRSVGRASTATHDMLAENPPHRQQCN